MRRRSPKKLAQDATYRAAHPERVKASALKYDLAHPEGRRRNSIRWRLKHLETHRQWKQAWRASNPEAVQAQKERRRALLEGVAINDFTAEQWRQMKAHYGHSCVYCGRKMTRLTMDHIIPLSQGGNHTYSNIVPACRSCNSRKHTGEVLRPIQPLLLIC